MDLSSHQKVQDYIGEVCSQIKFGEVHEEIKLELEAHIQELIDEFLAQGFSEKEAICKALAQMGDGKTLGKQLNKVHKPRPEWTILFFTLLFISTGLLTMGLIQKQNLLTRFQIFDRSLLFSFLGLIFTVGLYFFDYRKMEKFSKHLYLGTLFLLVYTILFGKQAVGSRSWLAFGPLSINFVAISPVLFMVSFAGIFNKWNWNKSLDLLQGLGVLSLPLLLYLAAPSISTSLIYVVACTVLMSISGVAFKKVLLLPASWLTILTLAILAKPYRLERFLAFLNPGNDPLGRGYLNVQLRKIFSNSRLLGQGLNFEPQILPEIHTDFVFAFITYSFGWLASSLLIVFIIIFLYRLIHLAKQVKNTYAKLLISGFTSILASQFVWNIFMNLGLAPVSEVGLPFISYGGSQLIINGAIIGVILSIYRRKNLSQSYIP